MTWLGTRLAVRGSHCAPLSPLQVSHGAASLVGAQASWVSCMTTSSVVWLVAGPDGRQYLLCVLLGPPLSVST